VCLACCLDDDGCDIVYEPPTTGFTGLSLKVAAVVGAVKLQFQRKDGVTGGTPTVGIKLKQSFLSGPAKRVVTLRAQLTGPDASLGGLLFPIAFPDSGPGALETLRARGLNVSLVGSPPLRTCQDVLPAAVCSMLAPLVGLDRFGARDRRRRRASGVRRPGRRSRVPALRALRATTFSSHARAEARMSW